MAKIRMNKSQNAQGMVEFALVLPILLMLILGVFAFGHLFYVYSSVVSASREAARWGAATGQSAGAGSLPRYQNCEEIRAAAARTAPISGITQVNSTDENTPGVLIQYDKGPSIAPYGTCVASPGPDVDLGDRIVVTVRVRYQPIVPLIPIPSFMLQANTARTIIKDMAVGVAPSAEPVVTGPVVTLKITTVPVTPILVSQPVTIAITAEGSDQAPVNDIVFNDNAGNDNTDCSPQTVAGNVKTLTCTITYSTERIIELTAVYAADGHFKKDAEEHEDLEVVSNVGAVTTITIDPKNSAPTLAVFNVSVTALSGAIPKGSVKVYVTDDVSKTCTIANLNPSTGQGSCPIPSLTTLGAIGMTAEYQSAEPANFYNKKYSFTYTIEKYETETVLSIPSGPFAPTTPIPFTVHVTSPNGIPTGTVKIVSGSSLRICNLDVNASTTCSLTLTNPGNNNVTATYEGSTIYNDSLDSGSVTVEVSCPVFGTIEFNSSSNVTNSLQFTINNNLSDDLTVQEVDVFWPSDTPSAFLRQIRFGINVNTTACISSGQQGSRTCFWDYGSPSGGLPPQTQAVTIPPTGDSLHNTSLNTGVQKTMLLAFHSAIPSGKYEVTVKFNNGCEKTVDRTK